MARSTKFLFPFAALGLISGLAGCGDDPVPAGTDAGTTPATDVPTTPADAGEARTYDYVINHLLLDEGAEPGVTTRAFYGFNLDGRISPTRPANQQPADCSRGDYFSTIDPDQNMGTCMAGTAGGGAACQGGVDNQLPNVGQTIMQFQASLNVQNTLNEQVDTGKFLILVRVTGVNGTLGPSLNDPSVHVLVYPFAYATFPNCANIQMANQMYQIDNRSLSTPGDLSSARLKFQGSIVNGRLRVNPAGRQPLGAQLLHPPLAPGDDAQPQPLPDPAARDPRRHRRYRRQPRRLPPPGRPHRRPHQHPRPHAVPRGRGPAHPGLRRHRHRGRPR
nr:hypothetical protein [Deltaproteobacteria bacterium]